MVPAYRRKESHMQYVENCILLLKESLRRCLKMSKRLDRFVGEPIVAHVETLWSNVIIISKLYARSDEESKKLRFDKIIESLAECNFLASMLDVAIELDNNLLTESQWNHWLNLINEEERLLEGLKKKFSKEL